MKELVNTLVNKLNKELLIAEKSGGLNNRRRTLYVKINPIRGLFLNTDKLSFEVDSNTDFRIEVDLIQVAWNRLLVFYKFNHFDHLND